MGKKSSSSTIPETNPRSGGMHAPLAGFAIVEAADGVEGRRDRRQLPDAALVICDVNMPNKNGLELLEGLRRRRDAHAAGVMLTTEGQPQLIERARKAGAKGWLVKPFQPDLLVAAVAGS